MTQEMIPDREAVNHSELISDIRQDLSSLESAILDRDNETELGEVEKIPDYLDSLEFSFQELSYQLGLQKIDELVYRDLRIKYENLLGIAGY